MTNGYTMADNSVQVLVLGTLGSNKTKAALAAYKGLQDFLEGLQALEFNDRTCPDAARFRSMLDNGDELLADDAIVNVEVLEFSEGVEVSVTPRGPDHPTMAEMKQKYEVQLSQMDEALRTRGDKIEELTKALALEQQKYQDLVELKAQTDELSRKRQELLTDAQRQLNAANNLKEQMRQQLEHLALRSKQLSYGMGDPSAEEAEQAAKAYQAKLAALQKEVDDLTSANGRLCEEKYNLKEAYERAEGLVGIANDARDYHWDRLKRKHKQLREQLRKMDDLREALPSLGRLIQLLTEE